MKVVALLVGLSVGAAMAASAEILAGWEVNGIDVDDGVGLVTNLPPYEFIANSNAQHVTGAVVLGEGVTPTTSPNQYGFKIPSATQTNSLAGAIGQNHYMEFSITVDEGYAVSLASIEMHGQSSGTGCSNVVLMTSVDGFAVGQEIASAFPATDTGGFDTDASGFGGPIDLSAAEYQNLTGSVVFRLYGWNSASGSGTTYLRNLTGLDLIVNGSVSPATGLGVPFLALFNSNAAFYVSAEFMEPATTNYVLQHRVGLTDSNGWDTVSTPFSSNAMWQVETTNSSGFYQAVIE